MPAAGVRLKQDEGFVDEFAGGNGPIERILASTGHTMRIFRAGAHDTICLRNRLTQGNDGSDRITLLVGIEERQSGDLIRDIEC